MITDKELSEWQERCKLILDSKWSGIMKPSAFLEILQHMPRLIAEVRELRRG